MPQDWVSFQPRRQNWLASDDPKHLPWCNQGSVHRYAKVHAVPVPADSEQGHRRRKYCSQDDWVGSRSWTCRIQSGLWVSSLWFSIPSQIHSIICLASKVSTSAVILQVITLVQQTLHVHALCVSEEHYSCADLYASTGLVTIDQSQNTTQQITRALLQHSPGVFWSAPTNCNCDVGLHAQLNGAELCRKGSNTTTELTPCIKIWEKL